MKPTRTAPTANTARNGCISVVAILGALFGAACASAARGAQDAAIDTGPAVVDDAAGEPTDALGDAATGDASATLPSSGCSGGRGGTAYPVGTTSAEIAYLGSPRTFRVHVPPGYDEMSPLPVVLMLHGGGGSGRQFEESSSRMDPIADRERFIAVYPDGSGLLRTWNGGGCCGFAVENNVDDVGFVAALLDHLEGALCVDRRRAFASGMSNGAILSHRLACELADRIAAVAPVAGTDMTSACAPTRPVPLLQIHGSSDGHVPWTGGEGCGLAGVSFTSVPVTMEAWRSRNGCAASTSLSLEQGDGRCETYTACGERADVMLCTIQGGGHNWPGGEPPAALVPCPTNGFQSTTFQASEVIWGFFADHPMPTR